MSQSTESVRLALTTLRSLYAKSLSGPDGGQFLHEYKKTDQRYEVIHIPDECRICEAFNVIEAGLLDKMEDGVLCTYSGDLNRMIDEVVEKTIQRQDDQV
jgi:hypothetical protein